MVSISRDTITINPLCFRFLVCPYTLHFSYFLVCTKNLSITSSLGFLPIRSGISSNLFTWTKFHDNNLNVPWCPLAWGFAYFMNMRQKLTSSQNHSAGWDSGSSYKLIGCLQNSFPSHDFCTSGSIFKPVIMARILLLLPVSLFSFCHISLTPGRESSLLWRARGIRSGLPG